MPVVPTAENAATAQSHARPPTATRQIRTPIGPRMHCQQSARRSAPCFKYGDFLISTVTVKEP